MAEQHEAVGCLVVRTKRAFSWLGHMPVLCWSADQVKEVRGLTKVVCVAPSALVARATTLLKVQGIPVVALPAKLSSRAGALEAWLTGPDGPAAQADSLLVVKATVPFVPTVKAEKCLELVRRGKCAVSATARTAKVVNPEGTAGPRHVDVVAGVRAIRLGAVGPFEAVPVTLTESLDVEHDDEFCVADALIEAGKI